MKLRSWLWDLLALAGVALVVVGLWWVHPSLSLVVGGACLTAGAVVGAKTWG